MVERGAAASDPDIITAVWGSSEGGASKEGKRMRKGGAKQVVEGEEGGAGDDLWDSTAAKVLTPADTAKQAPQKTNTAVAATLAMEKKRSIGSPSPTLQIGA